MKPETSKLSPPFGVARPFPPPSGAYSPADQPCCDRLSMANPTVGFESDNRAASENTSFTLNPAEFPSLISANPLGSTRLINNKHTLISLTIESDYNRLWLRWIWYLKGFSMRVFKWSPTFTLDQESSIVPVWVSFPELPAHLFHKDAIFSIASIVGTPLQMADSTYNQSKLSRARVCIEIDLLKPLLEEFDIQIQDRKIIQKIEYEKIPHYCSLCKHVGHQALECYSKGDASNPLANELTGKNKSAAGNEQKTSTENEREYGNATCLQGVRQMPARKESTVLERDECSKTAEERHRTHAIEANNGCDENHSAAIEIDAKDSLETVYELEESHENIVKPTDSVGTLIIRPNNSVCDLMRGKKRIKVDSVFRLLQTLKQVGVVIKGIKEDVGEAIKRNRLAVSLAILFQKCVMLYDPVRQLNLKPLDTGEQSRQIWAAGLGEKLWTELLLGWAKRTGLGGKEGSPCWAEKAGRPWTCALGLRVRGLVGLVLDWTLRVGLGLDLARWAQQPGRPWAADWAACGLDRCPSAPGLIVGPTKMATSTGLFCGLSLCNRGLAEMGWSWPN
ncbi:UNVERIFIED_CONTAM: hypothetical protein Sangu_1308600 [Sesamum angustifolium]|uniref:DUF4283 domain-containing protein n=1 Tax=Sesamum angustifolium TaxID=2727405 RepID=A0AAW2NL84_9LAMI